MVNTIGCVSYNTKERDKLCAEYLTVKKEADAISKEIFAIEDDAEYEKRLCEVDKASEKAVAAHKKCFAAQFHKCKNAWFANVVDSLTDGENKWITKRQYQCFAAYACDRDDNSWRSGESYCRVGSCLVTLTRYTIKKERI